MKTRCIAAAVILLALLAGSASAATAPVAPSFTKQFGSTGVDYAKDIVTDTDGNVYVAGTTHGEINSPTQRVPNANKGGADAFVAKFDSRGVLLWVTQFGSAADDFVEAISLDKIGSLYVAGWTRGSLPGSAEQSGTPNANAGGADIFLAKINTQS
ncbi:MAG TPA: SBBP repeat-containing protein, partial [Syntrophales bacterium]|nr:SBBP repeat-containing protein [Syntrophales bacterium]